MSFVDTNINLSVNEEVKALIYEDVKSIHFDPKCPATIEMMSGLAGYKATGLKNIVNEDRHALKAERFALLLRGLSKMGIHILHRHVIDSQNYVIQKRTSGLQPKGTLKEEGYDCMLLMIEAEKSLSINNATGLKNCLEQLETIVAQVRCELDFVESTMLRRNNDE